MRFIALVLLVLAISLGLGTWSVQWALTESADFGYIRIGEWTANPMAGSIEADPYSKARLARTGNLTLGVGEGVRLRAATDRLGRRLRRECNYVLEGQTPLASVWTLAAFSPQGRLIQPDRGRPGWLVSSNLIRRGDGVEVSIGPAPRPGNWLATAGSGPFILAFTLYDTPVSATAGMSDFPMPRIRLESC